ncbi:hypothetical protein [Arthrobacter silvisoli]|uniref:hypothetical protein n=1 Tax=Arthrobacter silvisoli TaxID=2291022 RepID=UPI001443C732|nr:hypothetical protein [Arthrobacter silvisoli]
MDLGVFMIGLVQGEGKVRQCAGTRASTAPEQRPEPFVRLGVERELDVKLLSP